MNNLIKKGVAFTIILLFISVSVTQSIGIHVTENNTRIIPSENEATIPNTTNHNGSLSGYVNNTYMNPIEGALVRVYFHGTYEENYTDSSGYYHVSNIPLCWCVKNATASKEGYKTEWVWLVIRENTTYDFILIPKNSPCIPVLNGTMGENGWYVSCVEINFTSDDNVSTIYYSIDYGSWQIFDGVPIVVCDDGLHIFCWYYIDNEGNESDVECIEFKNDQTQPDIDLVYEGPYSMFMDVKYTADCNDATSGIDKVEFYQDDELMYIDYEEPYEWIALRAEEKTISAVGLIFYPRFSEENITFFAFIVNAVINMPFNPPYSIRAQAYDIAGNSYDDSHQTPMDEYTDRIEFERVTFLNNYVGYIGIFLINARFNP